MVLSFLEINGKNLIDEGSVPQLQVDHFPDLPGVVGFLIEMVAIEAFGLNRIDDLSFVEGFGTEHGFDIIAEERLAEPVGIRVFEA